MNERLKSYLDRCSPAPADQSMVDDLYDEMEEAVPEIVENIRRREELAAQLRMRIAASRPPLPKGQDED